MPKATGDSTTPSALHNLATADLVDELGALKADLADRKAREELIRAELIARGVTEAEGCLFRATISQATRWTLDTDRVKAEMGQAWYETRCRGSETVTLRVSARRGIAAAA